MTDMKITGCVPLPGQGVVARFGDLVAVTEGTGSGNDPLLSALESVDSDAGDGAALVLAAARAVLANPGQPSGACAGVTSGGEVAVLVHGDAVVAVTVDGAADIELTASGSMLPVNRTFSGTTVSLRIAVGSRADFDPRLRLDGGVVYGSGLVVTASADVSAEAVARPRRAPAIAEALPGSRAGGSAAPSAVPAATCSPATPEAGREAAPVAGVAGDVLAGSPPAADEAVLRQAESSTERLSPGWPPAPSAPDWPPQPHPPGWQPEPPTPGWQPEPPTPAWQPEPPTPGWQAEPLTPQWPPAPVADAPPPPVPPGPVPTGPVSPGPGGTLLSSDFASQFPEAAIEESQAPGQAAGQASPLDEMWITPDDEEGWRAPAFVVPSQGQQPPGREPRLHQPDPTSDFESFLLIPQPGAPDEHDHPHPSEVAEAQLPPMPQEEADLYVPEPVLVDGVFCSRNHFNDPNVQYCRQCGISMVQITRKSRKGQRPPLGVLLLDDGTGFTLDRDYVVGREPVLDGDVAAGRARPLRITDPDGTVSRLHLRISLVGWQVEVRDLGSANGSVLYFPTGEQRLSPYDSAVIQPGARIGIGHRSLQYLSYRAG